MGPSTLRLNNQLPTTMKYIGLFTAFCLCLTSCDDAPSGYQYITLGEFNNRIHGNLGAYPIAIPKGFEKLDSNKSAFKRFLWGAPGAINREGTITDCVFDVVYSRDVTWKRNGYFGNAQMDMDKATLESQGVKNVKLISGHYRGMSVVPVLGISGELQGTPIYMAYLYSPYGDAAFAITIKGGEDDALRARHWEAMLESFEL